MKALFDQISYKISKNITRKYSTSFSFGIFLLNKKLHDAIYAIYGFVRVADEIVDSFHDFDKEELLTEFRKDTYQALERGISLNPVLNSFQEIVNLYNIERELIDTFLDSMEMDLNPQDYEQENFEKYILGSAEVVGLMCLRVFTENNRAFYDELKPYAMKLGSAFQKVNFLRDLKQDFDTLGRSYFPEIDLNNLSQQDKLNIEADIQNDFNEALIGIKKLPSSSMLGVYSAYMYYQVLLTKIKATAPQEVMSTRVRVPNSRKLFLMGKCYVQCRLNLI